MPARYLTDSDGAADPPEECALREALLAARGVGALAIDGATPEGRALLRLMVADCPLAARAVAARLLPRQE